MQGAEERRLNRMGQYAARPPARRAYAPEGGAIEGNAADNALLVIRALHADGFIYTIMGTDRQTREICDNDRPARRTL